MSLEKLKISVIFFMRSGMDRVSVRRFSQQLVLTRLDEEFMLVLATGLNFLVG